MESLYDGLTLGACSLALVLLVYGCALFFRRAKRPPGPPGYLCCGNSFQMDGDRIQHVLHDFHNTHGKVVRLNLFGTTVVSVASAQLLRETFERDPFCQLANDRPANSTTHLFNGRKHIGLANLSSITLMLREYHKSAAIYIFDHCTHLENQFEAEVSHLNVQFTRAKQHNPHVTLRIFYQNLCSILVSVMFCSFRL